MKREEAIAILDISKTCHGVSGRKYDEAIDMAIEALQAEPISCKDCKYKRLNDYGETRYYYCALKAHEEWSVDDTDFCSWGERKGVDDTTGESL